MNPSNPNDPMSSKDPLLPSDELEKIYGKEKIRASSDTPTPSVETPTTNPLYSETKDTHFRANPELTTAEKIKFKTEQVGETLKDKFKNFKDSRQVDDLYNYAVTNKEKTITYTLLILGLLILIFFNDLMGGLILGLLAGYYFSEEIVQYIRHLPELFEGRDQLRYVVLGFFLVGLLLTTPGMIIGAAVTASFKQIMYKKI